MTSEIATAQPVPADDRAAIYWGESNLPTETHAQRIGAPIHFVHYLGWKKGPLVAAAKYVPQTLKTWSILRRDKPDVVYVAISPVFAALAVYAYCWRRQAAFVMDVHNHALYGRQWSWSVPLVRFLARRALANVVDQPLNKKLFDSWGVPVFVLERPPISMDTITLETLAEPRAHAITVINTFADDEPIEPLLGAARLLPNVTFYILGNTDLADPADLAAAPTNVVFTSYLNGDEYWQRLHSSDGIIALTTADYSLLSAAIEAMAVNTPPILSRASALMEYFTRGTVFVDHTASSIANGVRHVLADDGQLIEEITSLNIEKRERWYAESNRLIELLDSRR